MIIWDSELGDFVVRKERHMNIMRFIEQLFWTIVWVFLALIVGMWILHTISGMNGVVGNIADWIGSRSEY